MQYLTGRRSVRQFQAHKPTEDDIQKVLTGGFHAPSATNSYPTEFIVLTDEADLKKVAEIHPYSKFTEQASFVIIVVGVVENGCKFGQEGFTIVDSCLAAQNLVTAGKIIGYDSTICGLYPVKQLEAKFAEVFNIPEGVIPICSITFGKKHPDCVIPDVQKYHEEKIHRGKW